MAKHKTRHERRTEILAAAYRCVARLGYEEMRLDDMVKESGLSKGAIYWYFESKQDILLALIDYWGEQMDRAYEDVMARHLSALETINKYGQVTFRMMEDNPGLFRAQVELWSGALREPEFSRKLQKIDQRFDSALVKVVQRGTTSGEFHPGLNPRSTALMIGVLLDGLVIHGLTHQKGFDPQKEWREIFKVIRSSLVNPKNEKGKARKRK